MLSQEWRKNATSHQTFLNATTINRTTMMTPKHNANVDESNTENRNDQKYITCTHVDKEWGKDFAGTNEAVALCTPPWHVLREALFGIVQSIKEDEALIHENETNRIHSNDTQQIQSPVDIAYVVVVSAAARVKPTIPRPRRRTILSNTTTTVTTTATSIRSKEDTPSQITTDNHEHVHPSDQITSSLSSISTPDPPKYKLLIDEEDHDDDGAVNDENDNKNHQIVDTNIHQRHHPQKETLMDSVSPSCIPQSTTTPVTFANRPKFRLCYE